MTVLRELGRDIAEEQDRRLRGLDPKKRMEDRFRRTTESMPRGSTPWPWLTGGAAAAAIAVAALLFLRAKIGQPLEFHVEGVAPPGKEATWVGAAQAPLSIAFSDGSQVVLGPGARARVRRLVKTGAEIDVEQGGVAVNIVPRQGNHWLLAMGPFTVEVTGTRFDVYWNPQAEKLKLTMHEGTVNVTGCGVGAGPLAAGEVLNVSCRDKKIEVTPLVRLEGPIPRVDEKLSAPSVDDREITAQRPRSADAKGDPRSNSGEGRTGKWKALAEAGRFREALAVAHAAGFEAECRRVSAADLLSLAATARLAGDAPKARQAYTILRKRFSSDPAASVAAFHLARIEFDMMSNYAAAARWFETYLREDPSGSLAPEAYGRRLEALNRAGEPSAARQAAIDYLSRYPNGPHAEFARRLAR